MNAAHVSSLAAKHARIEARIGDEQSRPQPDPVAVTALKKAKLRIKDAIEAR